MTSVSRLICDGVGDGIYCGREVLPTSAEYKSGKYDLCRSARKECTNTSPYMRRRSAILNGLPKRREEINLKRKRSRLQNNENAVPLNPQEGLPMGCVQLADFGTINQILTFVADPSHQLTSSAEIAVQQPEDEEVQVEVSNKWLESRGEGYVNLSILTEFPNPKITRSISLTKEGIQIFIHSIPLKNKHSVWNVLRSRANIETGRSLSILVNLVEKMEICAGCLDQKCRTL